MSMDHKGFPGGSDGKESAYKAGDQEGDGFNPELGRSPGERIGNPFQDSCLGKILVWEIPWTEEPGALQSMGLQRIGHD